MKATAHKGKCFTKLTCTRNKRINVQKLFRIKVTLQCIYYPKTQFQEMQTNMNCIVTHNN